MRDDGVYLFKPAFAKYSEVCHKSDKDRKMIVVNYCIVDFDQDLNVSVYTIGCSHSEGTNYYYPGELEEYVESYKFTKKG